MVVLLAYDSSKAYYSVIQELSSGKGYADVLFLPHKGVGKPAMIVELKWNKTAESAVKQMKDKKYVQAIEQYGGEILLVGISYDTKTKKHTCVIEQYNQV